MAIAAKAGQCAQHLEKVATAAISEEGRQGWENQIFRFNLWLENNFVFAPTRASMDWRLRNAGVLESSVCELLDDLQSSLIRTLATMKTATVKETMDQHDSVSTTLEELFRLSRAVRRSGILRRFVKMGFYVEYDENGVNLTEEFRKGVERVVQFRLGHAPASNDLKRRLVDTICLRQQHLAYLRAKWGNGRPKPSDTISTPIVAQSTLGPSFSVSGSIPSSTKRMRKKEMNAAPISVPSLMTATTAQPEKVRRERSVNSTLSVEYDEVECSHDDLPSPPKIPLHAVEYECPFCYMVCPSGEFSGERWKKHIVQDITPFFCVLDACRTPNALYESGRDWVKHMKTEHTHGGWTCMDESHDKTLFFNSDSAFKEHMISFHEDAFPKNELDDIAAASYSRLPVDSVIAVCPFCPISPQVDTPAEDMMAHVAEHLLSFTQISLSWQMDGEASLSQSSHAWSLEDQPEGSSTRFMTSHRGRLSEMTHARYLDHGLGELAKESAAKRHNSITYSSNLSTTLQPRGFNDFKDEEYATDPEYKPEQEDLPDADEDIYNSLWHNVRYQLHLPPLRSHPWDSPNAFQAQGTDNNTRYSSIMELKSSNGQPQRCSSTTAVVDSSEDENRRKSRGSWFPNLLAGYTVRSLFTNKGVGDTGKSRIQSPQKDRKSSSSSVDSNLAFGSAYFRKSPKSKKKGQKKQDLSDVDAALMGLGVAATELVATHGRRDRRRSNILADTASRCGPSNQILFGTEEEWEDIDSDDQSPSSVSSGLVY